MAPSADEIADPLPAPTALRHLHAHPELVFAEHGTAGIVASALRELGLEIHEGIGGTALVGVLRAGRGAAARACAPTWTRCR